MPSLSSSLRTLGLLEFRTRVTCFRQPGSGLVERLAANNAASIIIKALISQWSFTRLTAFRVLAATLSGIVESGSLAVGPSGTLEGSLGPSG